jgi:hypothetical protein
MMKLILRVSSGFVRLQFIRRKPVLLVKRERRSFMRLDLATVLTGLLVALVGCTTARTPFSGSTTPPPTGYTFLTGNWVIQTTPTSSPTPFTGLSGFIDEQDQNAGTNDALTAALEANPSNCYLGADAIPLEGTVQGTAVGLHSFSVNGQYVTITATKNTKATQLTGTYSVSGGCANGAAGNITGTRYAILNGAYAGTIAGGGQSIQVNVAQNTQGTGSGNFFVSGSATFAGISCFTTGTMAAENGSIIGNTVVLNFATNDPNGAQAVLTGQIDPAADTLTLSSVDVTGGSCAGSLGGATLTLQ